MNLHLQTSHSNGFWDKTGAAISWLCAIHCLILPFAIAALPFLGLSFLLDENVERLIIAVSIIVALTSLLPAYLHQHRKPKILILFLFGIGFIVFSHFFLEENLVLKIPSVLAGAVLVSAAHLINYRECRKCRKCCEIEIENKAV